MAALPKQSLVQMQLTAAAADVSCNCMGDRFGEGAIGRPGPPPPDSLWLQSFQRAGSVRHCRFMFPKICNCSCVFPSVFVIISCLCIRFTCSCFCSIARSLFCSFARSCVWGICRVRSTAGASTKSKGASGMASLRDMGSIVRDVALQVQLPAVGGHVATG